MAELAKDIMVKENTPKKTMFVNRPYSQEERLKKDEEELARLVEEQKGEGKTSEEEVESEAEPTSAEEKTFKKRYGDLRRHTQEKEQQFQKQLNDLKSQLDSATKKEMKLPKSDEDIEAWAKESDDFHSWADEQPKWVQDALYENDNDARSAARAIDLYKGDRGIGKETKTKSDKSAAKAVNTQGTRTNIDATGNSNKIRESTVQKMSAKEYEKKSEQIMEAIRSGDFIYDISGNAR